MSIFIATVTETLETCSARKPCHAISIPSARPLGRHALATIETGLDLSSVVAAMATVGKRVPETFPFFKEMCYHRNHLTSAKEESNGQPCCQKT